MNTLKRIVTGNILVLLMGIAAVLGVGCGMTGRGASSAGYAETSDPGGGNSFEIDSLGIDELWVVVRDETSNDETPSDVPDSPALKAVVDGEKEQIPLPLKHTAVSARIDVYLASVTVEQQYHNPYDAKIEVVYVFPLPQDAAVSEFLMKIGDRTIRGIIREREEAESIYEDARNRGYTASLLTQERPNVFTQKVANIEPKKEIDIALTYYNALPYRDGAYSFTFPTVVGPRFNPPGTTDGIGAHAAGSDPDGRQPVSVPYLTPSESSGQTFSMEIDLEAGMTIEAVDSPSHKIAIQDKGPTRRHISLGEGAAVDRDFRLRYKMAGKTVRNALITDETETGGYFTAVLTPPAELNLLSRAPVEHVFVLDCSGSMNGMPLDIAKDTVTRVLNRLTEEDTFQIIQFSSNASKLGARPIPATPENVREGLQYLRRLDGSGGTMMIEGIKAALDFPHEEGKVRIVSFLTDGYIGNEADILAAIHQKLGTSKIFSFGIGSAPNRYLLERMAKLGQGAVAYVNGDSAADRNAVDAFYERVSHPALSDIELSWGSSNVYDVYPTRIPDLWSDRPVIVTGKFKGRLGDDIQVSGRAGGKPVTYRMNARKRESERAPAIGQIWARMKIMDLADSFFWTKNTERLVADIKTTALDYGLMSKFTAFIAVDATRVTEGDHGYTVAQPVAVPHGVRYETTVPE